MKKGNDPIVLQRTVCLVIAPFTVGNHAFLFAYTMTGQMLHSMMAICSLGNLLQKRWVQKSHRVH